MSAPKTASIQFLTQEALQVKWAEGDMDRVITEDCDCAQAAGDPLDDSSTTGQTKKANWKERKHEKHYVYKLKNTETLIAWIIVRRDPSGEDRRIIRFALIDGVPYRPKPFNANGETTIDATQ